MLQHFAPIVGDLVMCWIAHTSDHGWNMANEYRSNHQDESAGIRKDCEHCIYRVSIELSFLSSKSHFHACFKLRSWRGVRSSLEEWHELREYSNSWENSETKIKALFNYDQALGTDGHYSFKKTNADETCMLLSRNKMLPSDS